MRAVRAMAAIAGWQVVASVCYYAIFAATPFVRTAFGASRFEVGLVVTVATLGYTLLLFPVGATVDALGERPVMVGGLLVLAAGATGVGLAGTYAALLVAVFVLGAAYATAMPATNRAVVASVPVDRRGLAMGVKQVGVTAGSGLSAIAVVTVAATLSTWRVGFLGVAVVGAVTAVAFGVVYRGSGGTGRWAWPDVRSMATAPSYVALVAVGLFMGAALFTTVGYATLYLVEGVGASPAVAGLGFAAMQATGSLGRVVAGWLADSRGGGGRASATVLAWQVGLGAVLLVVLAGSPSQAGALAALAGVGGTVLGFTGLYYGCMAAVVPEDELGAATAGGQTAINAGALVAPPAFGLLTDVASFRVGWLVLAAVVLIGTAAAVVVRRRAGRG